MTSGEWNYDPEAEKEQWKNKRFREGGGREEEWINTRSELDYTKILLDSLQFFSFQWSRIYKLVSCGIIEMSTQLRTGPQLNGPRELTQALCTYLVFPVSPFLSLKSIILCDLPVPTSRGTPDTPWELRWIIQGSQVLVAKGSIIKLSIIGFLIATETSYILQEVRCWSAARTAVKIIHPITLLNSDCVVRIGSVMVWWWINRKIIG